VPQSVSVLPFRVSLGSTLQDPTAPSDLALTTSCQAVEYLFGYICMRRQHAICVRLNMCRTKTLNQSINWSYNLTLLIVPYGQIMRQLTASHVTTVC